MIGFFLRLILMEFILLEGLKWDNLGSFCNIFELEVIVILFYRGGEVEVKNWFRVL